MKQVAGPKHSLRRAGQVPDGSFHYFYHFMAEDCDEQCLHIHFEHFVEDPRVQLNTVNSQAFQDIRFAAHGLEAALHLTVLGQTGAFECENLLQVDAVLLRAEDLRDAHDLTGTILETGHLHHDLDGSSKLLKDDSRRNFDVGHHHHSFQTGKRVPGRVGVD